MKRKGIFIAHENSNKLSVTHAGRHLQVQELEKGGIDLSDIQNFIGHKSIKSTQCYASQKSKK